MRILHVITTINRGGAENHLNDLVHAQRAAGHEVAVAYLKGDGYWAESLAAIGVPTYALGLGYYGDVRPVAKLAALIRRLSPAVLHAHMPPAEVYSRLALALARRKCRYIVSKHNDEPFHHGIGQAWMARWAARRADGIIAISGAVARFLRTQGLPADKIRQVHYGLDPIPYGQVAAAQVEAVRQEWGIARGTMVVGSVGRLVPQKAMHVLLQGFAQFADAAILPTRLVIVGTGPLEGELRLEARKLGIEDRVVWAGFRTDIAAVMAAFDVFVLTSAWEGFGLVLLEAMAANRPIVASRISAIPEIVAEGESGFLVDSGAAGQVAAALAKLADADLRERMGQAGHRRLGQHFSIGRMMAATDAVYGLEA
ncbi:MAG: glycosyltransferase [Magnetospirillum sp.]|nr:glycosyltransferase [Magnetospirillum sp.]